MSEKRVSLDVIGVAEPCHEDWETMTGGEQKKFCDSCAKHVHNLSEMTRDEAERFVGDHPTGVCIRFRRDAATGRVLTADDRPDQAGTRGTPRPHTPGGGRFSGRKKAPTHRISSASSRQSSRPRRGFHRVAGSIYLPFLSVFSLLAGGAAVLLGGGRAPGGPGCVMGQMIAGPPPAPEYTAAGVGTSPVPIPPAGFLTRPIAGPPPTAEPPAIMGLVAPPVMGRIAPGSAPQPAPAPVQPPEVMGEIEMIMGDIACPEEPLHAVEPIEAPPPPEADPEAAPEDPGAGPAAQN